MEADGGPPGHVAAHLLACAPAGDDWTVDRLEDAARRALDQGAPEVAASYLRRALAEPPEAARTPSLLLALGTAEWRIGHPDAIEHLEQARATAGADQSTLSAASTLLAVAYLVTDRGVQRSVEVLDGVRAAVQDANPWLALNFEAAIALVGMMDDRTAPDAFRRAAALGDQLETLTDPPLYLVVMLSNYCARVGRAAEAEALVKRALAYEPYPPPLDIALALIAPLTLIESYELQQRLCEDLFAAARRRGAMQEMVGICALRAAAATNRGALADAEADARWALERAEGIYRMQATSELIRLLVERDELSEAEEHVAQFADTGTSRSVEVARFLMARGGLRAAQGRLGEALDDFVECGRRCEPLGLNTLNGAPWRSEAAIVQAATGDPDGARRLADEQLELARAFGRPRTIGRLAAGVRADRGRQGRPGAAPRGDRDARGRPGAGRARAGADRLRRRAAARRATGGGAPRARARARPRPPLRGSADRGPGARRADHGGCKATARRDHRPRRVDRQRAAGRATRRRRADQPGDRPVAVHHDQDGVDAPQPHLSQARDHAP